MVLCIKALSVRAETERKKHCVGDGPMILKAAVQEVAASKDLSLPSNPGPVQFIHPSCNSASFLSFISSPFTLLGRQIINLSIP